MKTGAELIAAERERQVAREGWSAQHDAGHSAGELAMAAACYAAPEPIFVHREAEQAWLSGNDGGRGDRQLYAEGYYDPWPWDAGWDKREKHDRLRRLVIAGALIAAEIDRLQASA
jgi:hypothetical protein